MSSLGIGSVEPRPCADNSHIEAKPVPAGPRNKQGDKVEFGRSGHPGLTICARQYRKAPPFLAVLLFVWVVPCCRNVDRNCEGERNILHLSSLLGGRAARWR